MYKHKTGPTHTHKVSKLSQSNLASQLLVHQAFRQLCVLGSKDDSVESMAVLAPGTSDFLYAHSGASKPQNKTWADMVEIGTKSCELPEESQKHPTICCIMEIVDSCRHEPVACVYGNTEQQASLRIRAGISQIGPKHVWGKVFHMRMVSALPSADLGQCSPSCSFPWALPDQHPRGWVVHPRLVQSACGTVSAKRLDCML